LKRWSLTSNDTPTPTSDSNPAHRVTHPTIFDDCLHTFYQFLEAVEPYLQLHPYSNFRFGFPSSPFLLHDLFPPLYHDLKISCSGGALPPTSPLRQYQILIRLIALPTLEFFPASLPPFSLIRKRWRLTSNVIPTPTSHSDSPPRLTYPDLFPTLYHHFNIFLKRWCLTSNVTPTSTSDSDSPPRVTHPTIFSRLSTPIFTHHEAADPYLQRHPYTNEFQERVMP